MKYKLVKLIAKFFRHHKVQQHYDGHAVLKLIETRWVGHLRVSNSIFENYQHIMNTLLQITGAKAFDGDDVAIAAGLYHVMRSLEFVFILVFIKDLLLTIEPITKSLQGRAIGYKNSILLIRAVYATIQKMRSEENFKKYHSQATSLLEKLQPTESANRPIRKRHQSTKLKDSVVEGTLGQRYESIVDLKSGFYETIDIVLLEMTNRFEKNDAILTAIDTADEMDFEKLAELGIEIPNSIELAIAKEYLNETN